MNTFDLTEIRHVIWDWNGTLLDDAWLCVEVMDRMLRQRQLPGLDSARYQELFAFPVRSYYTRLGFDFDREPWEKVGTEFIDGYQARQHECRLQPGAVEALEKLAQRGIGCSVLSASQLRRLETQAQALGVRQRFVALRGLDDHYAGSKLELGRRWFEQLNLPGEQVLLIGDTDHDAEVAAALGVRCALVLSGHQSRERLSRLGPAVLDSLRSLSA